MFDGVLKRMQEGIRTRQYVMTLHAEEEMDADNLSIFDIERGILTGTIIERQKDRDSAEWKYLIEGRTIAEKRLIVVAKLGISGKLVIITVYKI